LDIVTAPAVFVVFTHQWPSAHFLLFMLCSVLADAGACTINDVGDYDSDRRSTETNRSKRPLPAGLTTQRAAVIQAVVLYSLAIIVAMYLGFFVFLFAFLLIVLSTQYSLPPLKLDGRPIVNHFFWVGFGILYFCAVGAYVVKYADVAWGDMYYAVYFLGVLVLFAAGAEILAKDLRDLENDTLAGKITTPVYIGPKKAAVAAFVFSLSGMIIWAIPYFAVYDVPVFIRAMILFVIVFWNGICFFLCRSLYREYTKARARELHLGFILTLICILALSFYAGLS
jgi:4-hydroxybenzoate polyprenyltransferase